jgi:hypothetical protein
MFLAAADPDEDVSTAIAFDQETMGKYDHQVKDFSQFRECWSAEWSCRPRTTSDSRK